jgi:hypothetical protein
LEHRLSNKKEQLMPNKKFSIIILLSLALISLACGSLQVGVITPTSEEAFINAEDAQDPTSDIGISLTPEESSPPMEDTGDKPAEDSSHLWVEYWNPVFNYGIALPSHWLVQTDSESGFTSTRSYDTDFFDANSIKGNWIGGEAPEGAVKLDFVPFEGIFPEQSLSTAISDILGSDPEMTVVLSVEEINIGNHEAVRTTTARPNDLENTTSNIAFRLSPEVIVLVAAYPNSAHFTSDVQMILSSLVLNKSTPIVKPTMSPYPPLIVKNEELSGQPTATTAIAWYGHIASLPDGNPYDDKVVLSPSGVGEFGIKGNTPDIEKKIHTLRDGTGPTEYIHLWGLLYCNVDDYNTCQLNVDRLEYGDQYTNAVSAVDQWVGNIRSTTFNGASTYVFELSGNAPIWYGIAARNDAALQGQIEDLADSDTLVNVWGDLLVGVNDINGTRIEVSRLDPPSPGALPASNSCDSGYLGSVEEALEFVQYNLEIGNHWPFSYFIGNPFVIGYWQSEGVAIPRDQAYQQLTEQYLPSPDEVIIISDRDEYPDLFGIAVENMFGPDVDVATTIYSKGWGPDGQGEAILYIARCQDDTHDAYFWYGIVYAGDGFK